ncbi:DUF434 domain-containing protein [Thermococcus sp.]
MRRSSDLFEAYKDFKYLLNKGYRKKVALNFVANHYKLTLRQRHFLARCVFSDFEIEGRKRKLVESSFLRDKALGIDGFNVLITFESLIEGKAILCEDGLLRDLKYQRGYRMSGETKGIIETIVSFLSTLKPREVVFLYDMGVSRSGEIAGLTMDLIKKYGLKGKALTVKSPDYELRSFEVVCTSDIGIISKISYVFDLPKALGAFLGMRPKRFMELFDKQSLDKF